MKFDEDLFKDTLLQPPPDAEVTEWPSSVTWQDEEGILYSISKPGTTSFEETKKIVAEFIKYDKKFCLLIDVTHSSETTREVREYVAEEFPKFVKAIAMISKSSLGKMVANIFFALKAQPYPKKFFNDEHEAREWLRQYL